MPSTHLDRRCTDSLRRRARKDRSPFRACALFDSVSVSVSTKALITRGRVLRVLGVFGSSVIFGYRGSAPRYGYLTAERLGPVASVALGVDHPLALV